MSRRVVTLPPGLDPGAQVAFAQSARQHGAELLELRTDLHLGAEIESLRAVLPLLVAERGAPLPEIWVTRGAEVDRPAGADRATIWSLHAGTPLTSEEALAHWERTGLPDGVALKHVEPLGPLDATQRVFETQALLGRRFGAARVTVLATGPLALPFRCLLAVRNSLDYLALDGSFAAAVGQRLLGDAVREGDSPLPRPRFGILGHGIEHSRSPRIHRQPFDRIDLPASARLDELLQALHAHYAGLAITSPFKAQAARLVGSLLPAVNTLVRRGPGWLGANTDVDGAHALLDVFGRAGVTVLGDGGATAALRLAAQTRGLSLQVLKRAGIHRQLGGDIVWTWPSSMEPPPALRFREARVAIVAYGSPARRIADWIRQRGGEPVRLGPRWFVAQARAQRKLWDGAW